MSTTSVRQRTGELRVQYEHSSAHFGRRVMARFLNRLKISKALPDNIRDMAIMYDNSRHIATALRLSYEMWRVVNSPYVVAKLLTVLQAL